MLIRENHNLRRALTQFSNLTPDALRITALSGGHINETYAVEEADRTFILQRINQAVFPQPECVAENFQTVTSCILQYNQQQPRQLVCAQVLHSLTGQLYWLDEDGGAWRAQTYLDTHIPSEQLGHQALFELGQVLARFHQATSELDITQLHEPLPGFHSTPGYLARFDAVEEKKKPADTEDLRFCLSVINEYRHLASFLEKAVSDTIIFRRTIHGDPKIENFVFNRSGKAVGLLDLDTVGAGLLVHDLGDCLRSCCNTAKENEADWSKAQFDLDACAAFLAGYGDESSGEDIFCLYEGMLLISYELGLRFLTDHLEGDRYFRVSHHGENLSRAMVQLNLVQSIARQEKHLRELIREYL